VSNVLDFTRKKKGPAFCVNAGDFVSVVSVSDIKALASGKSSIAEYGDPEKLARALAVIILDYINVAD
jgi:hypothetical protein